MVFDGTERETLQTMKRYIFIYIYKYYIYIQIERRGVTVTDSEPLDGASAHDPEFQMFIDRNGSHNL